jgi:hypothetical protein
VTFLCSCSSADERLVRRPLGDRDERALGRTDPIRRQYFYLVRGAHVGLTPKRYQSGEIDYDGQVSKCGDAMLRTMLYEAAHSLLTHTRQWSWLKAWGIRVAQRRGMRRAVVAVARRLAVVLHRMWVDGSEFRWCKDNAAVPAVS